VLATVLTAVFATVVTAVVPTVMTAQLAGQLRVISDRLFHAMARALVAAAPPVALAAAVASTTAAAATPASASERRVGVEDEGHEHREEKGESAHRWLLLVG
jgi:hypothetical protein